MNIGENLRKLRDELPAGIRVVAVSKTQPVEAVQAAYDAGQRIFGENKVQELVAKSPLLPGDIEWHFVGHLQRNKVRQVLRAASFIHSIDSYRLLCVVNQEAQKRNRLVDCLLQFHIAVEETKFGLDLDEALGFLSSGEYKRLTSIRLRGVMGMATYTGDEELIRREFRSLYAIYRRLKSEFFQVDPGFSEISMGMSGDYRLAIEEGSTLIRIGTHIFGERTAQR